MAAEELIKSFQLLTHVTKVCELMKEGKDAASAEMFAISNIFTKCEELLRDLPGGEMTHKQQEEELERLKQDLVSKRKLVEKYKKLEVLVQDHNEDSANKSNMLDEGKNGNGEIKDIDDILMKP